MNLIQNIRKLFTTWFTKEAEISNAVYMHEAGHAVVAKLFEDVFFTKFVTVNDGRSKQHDKSSVGGLNGTPFYKTIPPCTLEEMNKMFLILLAGYCTELIMLFNGFPPEEAFTDEHTKENIGQYRFSGDIELCNDLFIINGTQLIFIGFVPYISLCARELCKILVDEPVWQTINDVANKLKQRDNKTLTSIQLTQVFAQNGFADWAAQHPSLITPLQIETLKHKFYKSKRRQ